MQNKFPGGLPLQHLVDAIGNFDNICHFPDRFEENHEFIPPQAGDQIRVADTGLQVIQ